MYVYGYPRQIYTGWLSSIINIDEVLDISMFIYPVDTQVVLNNLRKKVTQLEASMSINSEKGKVRDPGLEAALQDAEELRDQLQIGAEKFFRYGLYITLYADSMDDLNFVQHKIETIFGQQLIFSKVASSQQEQGLNSTIPQLTDQLQIRRNMNTGAISTSFPRAQSTASISTSFSSGSSKHAARSASVMPSAPRSPTACTSFASSDPLSRTASEAITRASFRLCRYGCSSKITPPPTVSSGE